MVYYGYSGYQDNLIDKSYQSSQSYLEHRIVCDE